MFDSEPGAPVVPLGAVPPSLEGRELFKKRLAASPSTNALPRNTAGERRAKFSVSLIS
jgi:hypothetical protein